ncbi:MAG: TIGR00159 family protein [Elusimicrobia bacterium]|jgi:diadenylate cyclase|nr:TIGR00159 family protein [Elusimicrobiota bacterium]
MSAFFFRFWQGPFLHVVDVVLVSILIYHVLLLIQGTRAVQVLRGFVVLAVATVVADRLLGLPTLGWLLRTFWIAWAVVFAVVFQPELRALLAHLGSHRLGRSLIPQELGFIDEIIAALREGAAGRVGMLIVLEQETGLRNFIGTGTVINGQVSRELLSTLFFPHTPLHDGAAILREDRVVAAGCVLPLSNDTELSRVMGTRHRAALGLSEISDAIVIVLSEETGTVSMVRHGHLDRDVPLDELQRRLMEFYKSIGEKGLRNRRTREGDL